MKAKAQTMLWKREISIVCLVLILASLVGWFAGAMSESLLIAAMFYIFWLLYQCYRWQCQNFGEKKRLQGVIDYLRDSFASFSDAVVMIDRHGNIDWSNQAAKQLLGLQYPQDKGQPLIHWIQNARFVAFYDRGDYRKPLAMASPVDANKRLQCHITFFSKGSRLLLAKDVTKTYRLQQMRTDFIANVSHELRTPLTVISGYLETLLAIGLTDERRTHRIIDQMLNQAQRMENLIRDLILLSRLEHVPDTTEQERITLRPLLETIREDVLSAVNTKKHIDIDCDNSLLLMGNADELRSAFSNLVMNAARYTDEGGYIQLRWYVSDRKGAIFEVEDDGIGIEPQHWRRLSERFYRVDKSRSMNTGGTGLGLAITKHVLLRHQAKLRITSRYGEGSTFSCVFPPQRVRRKEKKLEKKRN